MRLVPGLCMAVLVAGPALAKEGLDSPFEDRFRLTAGWLRASTSTDIRLDATNATPGTALSAEDDLGLRDSSDMADVEAQLRLRERHQVRFGYFQSDRKASTRLDRQIRFGDDLYQVNDVVNSQLDISSFNVTYSYSFLRRERYELGASFGLQMLQFEARARVPARNLDEEESQTGPVPTLGLQAAVNVSRRWHAEARAEYLKVHVDDFEGKFTNARAAIWYRFNRNLSAGLGYTMLNAEVISSDVGDSGRFEFGNDGVELLFRASF